MTIRGLGKPVPSQIYLLQLAGMVINYRRGPVDNPTENEINESKAEGLADLKRLTGMDYGYDVMQWYNYLLETDHGINHPYFYSTLKEKLSDMGYQLPTKEGDKK